MHDEVSLGGNLNQAVRVGDTVRRRAGPWTPAVHALLRYLENTDFEAPRVLGIDQQGREILGYIQGEAYAGGTVAVPDRVLDEEHLVDAASLLRLYHDVVAGFSPPRDARWRLSAPTEHELICHNDWSPWNALFRDDRLAVMLDWISLGRDRDSGTSRTPPTAGFRSSRGRSVFSTAEQARRLRIFCDAYGLTTRSAVLSTMRLRIDHVARFIDAQARAGDPGFAQLVRWNTPALMDNDIAYLEMHEAVFERALA